MSADMGFLSADDLTAWVAEFAARGLAPTARARVIEQDGAQGADTGLVAVELPGLSVYLGPETSGASRWVVTIEAREDASDLRPAEVAQLASELATVAELCAFLEAKSLARET